MNILLAWVISSQDLLNFNDLYNNTSLLIKSNNQFLGNDSLLWNNTNCKDHTISMQY